MLTGMGATVEEIAERMCVDPADIRVLLALYADDVDDLWEEDAPASTVGIEEVPRALDPDNERGVPARYAPR
jgi:hypothetical protein